MKRTIKRLAAVLAIAGERDHRTARWSHLDQVER